MSNLLLVEDEMRVADFIRRGLGAESYLVTHAASGEEALEHLRDGAFDLVILDLMLPGVSGRDVCRQMRSRKDQTPILMLTALDSIDDRVGGLRLGADDYLPKPFDFEELLARVEALLRRSAVTPTTDDNLICFEGVILDKSSLETTVDGKLIELSAKERDLLRLFLANPKKVMSRERILNSVWSSQEDPMTNIVDVYVARLRKKLSGYGDSIHTVRGAGYRLG